MLQEKKTTAAATTPIRTSEQDKERLCANVMRQLNEGGSQAATCQAVLGTEAKYAKFQENLRKFVGTIHADELPRTRVYVVADDKCNFRINAVRPDAISLHPLYTMVLEEDLTYGTEGSLVMRVILNKEDQITRMQNFFETLDFHEVPKKVLSDILGHMDEHAGITVRQMLFSTFGETFKGRCDWFAFSDKPGESEECDCYGIFDQGELILTHVRWKRSVSLKMPANGSRPWLYHFFKAEDGSGPSADFRVNAYGNLWHEPRWAETENK